MLSSLVSPHSELIKGALSWLMLAHRLLWRPFKRPGTICGRAWFFTVRLKKPERWLQGKPHPNTNLHGLLSLQSKKEPPQRYQLMEVVMPPAGWLLWIRRTKNVNKAGTSLALGPIREDEKPPGAGQPQSASLFLSPSSLTRKGNRLVRASTKRRETSMSSRVTECSRWSWPAWLMTGAAMETWCSSPIFYWPPWRNTT